MHQGDDPRFQGGEEGVQLPLIPAFFKIVQAGGVISGVFVVSQVDSPAGIVHKRSEGVPEQGKIVGLLGGQPVAVGFVGGQVHLKGELGSEILGLFVSVVKVLNSLFLHRAQTLAVLVKRADQALIFSGMGQLVELLAQNGHVLAGLGHALLRGAALHIKLQLAQAAAVCVNLLQKLEELFQFLLVGHN